MWSWEAFAHGAGCVSYFRWRQAPFAQEQMHAGLNTPDNQLDLGGSEAQVVAQEIERVMEAGGDASVSTKVALVWDYEAKWVFEIHPQGADFAYPRFAFEYYSALRSLGLDVDIIPANAALDGYRMIVVPPLPMVPDDFAQRLAASGAQVVLGPRTGSKTRDLSIPANLPPGTLADHVMPIRVWRVESMRPTVTEKVGDGFARHWRDFIEVREGVEVDATFADGHPAIVRHGPTRYLASLFDDTTTQQLFLKVAGEAGLQAEPLADGVRISRRGALTYVFNYNATPYRVTAAKDFVVGQAEVEPQGVAIYRH
jgi:beta-galactosidase